MKKYLFIHIAKAAGSSINHFFKEVFGEERCAIHLESNQSWISAEKSKEIAEGNLYISGHMPLKEFSKRVPIEDFFSFTFLRNPIEHVISHIAWIRKLSDPGEEKRLNAHPGYIQELSKKLATIDLSNPSDIATLIKELNPTEFALLDNPQVRYLRTTQNLGHVTKEDAKSAALNLRSIDFFGLVENMDNDLSYLASSFGMRLSTPAPEKNTLTEKYGLSADSQEIYLALSPLIHYDKILYETALTLKSIPYAKNIESRIDLSGTNITIDKAWNGVVAGWAKSSDKNPVSLDIFINQRYVGSTTANMYRSDLKSIFNKDCAFHYEIPKKHNPKEGDTVTIRVSEAPTIERKIEIKPDKIQNQKIP